MNLKLTFLVLLIGQLSFAQTYIPGQTYFGTNDYIEYIAGNLPIVLSAPHGGYLEPASIPDRDCSGCVYVRDSYTQELIRETTEAIFEETGCYPHAVINLLHRKKLDANRSVETAADGNPIAAESWQIFHDFIDGAKAQIELEAGAGLYFDLHGHGHDIQRIELGYLISGANLRKSDDELISGTFAENSSIAHAVDHFSNNFDFAELLRGSVSFGNRLEEQGYAAVPSSNDPFPNSGESFFSGGYNTQRHGSEAGGHIDGIQIECNQGIRFVETTRKEFAKGLAKAILNYYKTFNYDWDLGNCKSSAVTDYLAQEFQFYPNPNSGKLNIVSPNFPSQIQLLDAFGKVVENLPIFDNKTSLNLNLPNGLYFLIHQSDQSIQVEKLIVSKEQ